MTFKVNSIAIASCMNNLALRGRFPGENLFMSQQNAALRKIQGKNIKPAEGS
jgi:hypothetical protein